MATISRRLPLDGLPPVVCPAASPIAGASPSRCGVVCGVIANDRQREPGDGLSAGQLASVRDAEDGVFLKITRDPSTIERLCCGTALPVIDDGGQYARDHHTYCPVWQAEKKRIWDARSLLAGGGLGEQQREAEAVYDPETEITTFDGAGERIA